MHGLGIEVIGVYIDVKFGAKCAELFISGSLLEREVILLRVLVVPMKYCSASICATVRAVCFFISCILGPMLWTDESVRAARNVV